MVSETEREGAGLARVGAGLGDEAGVLLAHASRPRPAHPAAGQAAVRAAGRVLAPAPNRCTQRESTNQLTNLQPISKPNKPSAAGTHWPLFARVTQSPPHCGQSAQRAAVTGPHRTAAAGMSSQDLSAASHPGQAGDRSRPGRGSHRRRAGSRHSSSRCPARTRLDSI